MRCIACNKLMMDTEVTQYKGDDEPEDMCSTCKSASNSEWNYTSDHINVGGSFEEGLSSAKMYRE